RHSETLTLASLFLAVFSVGYSIYQNQSAEQSQRVLQSEVQAAFQGLGAIQHGANAVIFQRPNGEYSSNITESFRAKMTLSESLSAVVTCRDGTTITSGSCLGEQDEAPEFALTVGRR